MDKYEYKVRSDEIKSLIGQGDYVQAAEIADTIDWRRVKSVMMLCTVSDLYKINRRYEDAKNMLLLAYERRPGGRTICYSLCELCIKTEEFLQAVNYYKEFVQVAPKDSGRYILQYKLYEAQEVSLEERIGVLEELKKRDYREKWAYELAYLYHRVGLATRCVEECDEMILWFGEGKYVVKAMELKMLHQPLSPAQQEVYDRRFEERPPEDMPQEAADQEIYENQDYVQSSLEEQGDGDSWPSEDGQTDVYGREPAENGGAAEEDLSEELDIQVKTVDVGQYNTINLQAELAAGLQEVLGADGVAYPEEGADGPDMTGEAQEAGYQGYEAEQIEDSEIFFGATGELEDMAAEMTQDIVGNYAEIPEEPESEPEVSETGTEAAESEMAGQREEPAKKAETDEGQEAELPEAPGNKGGDETAEHVAEPPQAFPGSIQPPRELADVLSQEADGQISMVMPESTTIEKQITGQMKIEDILVEWEKFKKENEQKCKEEVRRHVLSQTGPLFTEFEATVRDGLLEQLENAEADKAEFGAGPEEAAKDIEEIELMDMETADAEFGEKSVQTVAGAEAGYAAAGSGETAGYPGESGAEEGPDTDGGTEVEYTGGAGEEDGAGYVEEADYVEEPVLEDEGEYAEEAVFEGEAYDIEEGEIEDEGEYADEIRDEVDYAEGAGYEDEAEYARETAYGDENGYIEQTAFEEEAEVDYTEGNETEVEPEYEVEARFRDADTGYEDEAEYLEGAEAASDPEALKEAGEGESEKEQKAAGDADSFLEDGAQKDDIVEEIEEIQEQVEEEESAGQQPETAQGEAHRAKSGATRDDRPAVERDKAKVRSLTREEKELFAPFVQSRRSKEQLVKALDSISMAAYTGNLIITGEEGMDTLTLAKNMMREIRMIDSNFSGKVAKVSGQGLNQKDVAQTLEQLINGALIIQNASGMSSETAATLHKLLQHERFGIIIVLEDTKKAIKKLFLGTPDLYGDFTARVDLEALSNDTLVSFGRQYAREKEYSIDNLGVLALHTRIEELQTIDHVVTVLEVKQIVDEAIRRASRKTLGHLVDVLLARRYDDEDMVILTEKDFVA